MEAILLFGEKESEDIEYIMHERDEEYMYKDDSIKLVGSIVWKILKFIYANNYKQSILDRLCEKSVKAKFMIFLKLLVLR